MSINLEPRTATIEELHQAQLEIAKELLTRNYRNCTTCIYFDLKKELCTKVNINPPATVIVEGCEMWDGVPF